MGMLVAGVPYSSDEFGNLDAITGGTPYDPSTIAGLKGERQPTATELAIATLQRKYVAKVAAKLPTS